MKILSNKAYRELIAEKELTELSLKSLKSKYDFIVEENKRLHMKNDLLHIEIKSLSEKADKYDIYLEKCRARKAKARAKAKEFRKDFIDFIEKNLGNCYSVPDFGDCFLCGYSKDLYFVVLGSDVNEGWNDTSDCVILKEYKYYKFSFLGDIKPIEETNLF